MSSSHIPPLVVSHIFLFFHGHWVPHFFYRQMSDPVLYTVGLSATFWSMNSSIWSFLAAIHLLNNKFHELSPSGGHHALLFDQGFQKISDSDCSECHLTVLCIYDIVQLNGWKKIEYFWATFEGIIFNFLWAKNIVVFALKICMISLIFLVKNRLLLKSKSWV